LGGGPGHLLLLLRALRVAAGNLRQHVRLAQHQHLVGAELDLRAAVLGEDDLVADGDVQRHELALLVAGARADREHAAALRLLLRRVRQDDAAGRGLLVFEGLHDQAVAQWLEIHPAPPSVLRLCDTLWHSPLWSARALYPFGRESCGDNAATCDLRVTNLGMKRECSAGGVLVRRLRGRWVFAAIRPAGKKHGLWALPKGQIDESERPEETAVREAAEETRAHGRVVEKRGDVRDGSLW